MLPFLYRTITPALAALVIAYLRRRVDRGKEDPVRLSERFGIAGRSRPLARVVWIHAASVGEATAMLSLIGRILLERPSLEILVTTGTLASAQLLEARLPPRARHQFIPVDLPLWIERFLDHWRPDLALWVESELWPNLVLATRSRGVPMVLLNARLSAGSYARWRWLPGLIRPVLGAFELCLTPDQTQAERLRRLGAREVAIVGDLKAAAEPLPVEMLQLQKLGQQIGPRPLWLAASTHPGEEEIAAAVHLSLIGNHMGLLTMLVPRHPTRADAIEAMLAMHGLHVARRSRGEPVTAHTDVYLADTMGELGLFYALAEIAFVGGSLVPKGGHNPLEAARLDCAVLHGPCIANCASMAADLAAVGAAETVRNADELGAAVSALLGDPQLRDQRAAAGRRVALAGLGVLDTVLVRLAPWLDRMAPIETETAPARLVRV